MQNENTRFTRKSKFFIVFILICSLWVSNNCLGDEHSIYYEKCNFYLNHGETQNFIEILEWDDNTEQIVSFLRMINKKTSTPCFSSTPCLSIDKVATSIQIPWFIYKKQLSLADKGNGVIIHYNPLLCPMCACIALAVMPAIQIESK